MSDQKSSLSSWKLDLESIIPDRKSQVDPPGYDATVAKDPIVSYSAGKKKDHHAVTRRQQALFARAQAPLKQVGMMCFMAWMFGNSIQIFSIMMTFTLIGQPLNAIMSSGQAFPKDAEWEQLDVLTPRLLYCVIHFGQFIFGLYKLNAMGLLPVHPSDWISTMQVPPSLEYSFQAA